MNNDAYAVANALGSPLNAPAFSAVYLVEYYASDDTPEMSYLGTYSSEADAKVALANLVCEILLSYEMDAPWCAELPDDTDLTAEMNYELMQAWVKERSADDIIAELYDSKSDYVISKLVVNGAQTLGDVSQPQ